MDANVTPASPQTYYALIASQTLSLIGSNVTAFAVGIWLFERTGAATPLTLVGAFVWLSRIVAAGFGGALADRYDRRFVMIAADCGAAFGTVLLLASLASGAFELWHLFVVVVIQGACNSMQSPAFQATLTLLVPDARRDRANAIQQLWRPCSRRARAAARWSDLRIERCVGGDRARSRHIRNRDARPRAVAYSSTRQGRTGTRGKLVAPRGRRVSISRRTTRAAVVLCIHCDREFPRQPRDSAADTVRARAHRQRDEPRHGLRCCECRGDRRRDRGGDPGRHAPANSRHHVVRRRTGGWTRPRGHCTRRVDPWCSALPRDVSAAVRGGPTSSILQAKVAVDVQGRVFAAVGQINVALIPLSYLIAGPLADRVFEPMVTTDAWRVVAPLVGATPGSGTGAIFVLCGLAAALVTFGAYAMRRIRDIETTLPDQPPPATPVSAR